jgi:NitT/TauT family transport system substrate-binding protein
MQRTRLMKSLAVFAVAGLALAACGDDSDDGSTDATTPAAGTSGGGEMAAICDASKAPAELTPVKLQLQWFAQAQFAGYYAAADQGCFAEAGLDVTILEGAVEIVPQDVLASGGADFALSWVPKALATREAGADIVNIAQVFQRSGTLQVSWKDSGIASSAEFAGKKIGSWGFGNEFEIFAALGKAGLDPATDVEIISQGFDMSGLLNGDIDAAQAMIYNEYAQVLEAINPDTGALYTPDDLNVVSYEDEGVGMLQDAIWADGKRLADDPAYKETAVKFVKASLKGWVYCRDNPESCRDIVVAAGTKLGASHQLWQMNEVNGLIWPAAEGVGFINQEAWDRTVKLASETPNLDGATVLTKPVDDGAFTNEIVQAALDELKAEGVDVNGDGWSRITVELQEGGV